MEINEIIEDQLLWNRDEVTAEDIVKALAEAGYSIIRNATPEDLATSVIALCLARPRADRETVLTQIRHNHSFCSSCGSEGLPCHCENDA